MIQTRGVSPFITPDYAIRALGAIALFYSTWTGVAILARSVSVFLPATHFPPDWQISTAICGYILLAAGITAVFLRRVQPMLEDRHRFRGALIVASAAVSVCFYAYTRFCITGSSGFVSILNTANLIVFANLVGTWMAHPLKRPAELVPVCLVMTMADLFSVIRGPSRKIIETLQAYYAAGEAGAPPAADFVLVKIAIPGMDRLVPVFGLADWIMVAFFAAAAAKFHMNDNLAGRGRRPVLYLPVSGLGLLAAVLLARRFGMFLPALPFVVLFFMTYILCRYPEARRLSGSDWRTTGGAAVVMGALMAVLLVA